MGNTCPAVTELRDALKNSIPFLAGNYREVNGKFLPRLQWWKDGSLNRHDAGLALDIILFAHVESEKILGENLFSAFYDYQPEMKWLGLIYENIYVSGNGVPKHYTQDSKHYTHIHIDWMNYSLYVQTGKKSIPWSAEAYTTGFGSYLSQVLKDLNSDWLNGNLTSLNLMRLSKIVVGPITTG